MTVKVELDRDLCIGTGNCIHHAEGAFELDDEGLSVLVDPDAATIEQLKLAERDCPARAIKVVEDN